MGSTRRSATQAAMTVRRPMAHVLETVTRGYSARHDITRALDEADALLAAHPEVDTLLWNAAAHEGHDPGNAAIALKWISDKRVFRRIAMVTTQPSMAALVNVGRVMLPDAEVEVFARREDALPWITRAPGRARRTSAP